MYKYDGTTRTTSHSLELLDVRIGTDAVVLCRVAQRLFPHTGPWVLTVPLVQFCVGAFAERYSEMARPWPTPMPPRLRTNRAD